MKIIGAIRYSEKGLTASLRAMHVQSELIAMSNENVIGFDKVGYQRKDPVVSSFTEFMGVHGLSQTVDDKVGRIMASDNPLDVSLANKGYFTIETPDGIELTRDGRFKVDKDGNLLNLVDCPVLSNTGTPIKLPVVPKDPKEIVINAKGLVSVFNPKTNKLEDVGYLGVADSTGALVMDPQVKQGYNEFSNVSLQDEFISMMPVRRNFEANRQIFMIQNQTLQKVISQLGSAQ
jgi:flagellar basal body rod protein FlgG